MKLLQMLRNRLKRLFRVYPSRKKEFFTFGKAHGVPECRINEYYRHCKRVSWLGLFGKPIYWQSVLLRLGSK